MTQREIEELLEDTRKTPRAGDKVTLAMALGVLEVARQLVILNENLAGSEGERGKARAKATKK